MTTRNVTESSPPWQPLLQVSAFPFKHIEVTKKSSETERRAGEYSEMTTRNEYRAKIYNYNYSLNIMRTIDKIWNVSQDVENGKIYLLKVS